MVRFNFEKSLEHQSQAVASVIDIFEGVEIIKPKETDKEFSNPLFQKDTNSKYARNIERIQEQNEIKRKVSGQSNVLDIKMETGTGKTYTYTKTIFELNKLYGIFKFVIVVPTLPIKAGTIDFLNSDSSREHFKEQYGKTIKLHIVESKKAGKSKKFYMPSAINSFVTNGGFEKDKIQVLIINAGMINSKTMQEKFDKTLLDRHNVPFDAVSATKPFMIIDEPHKFDRENTTWQNIQKMNPQFIIRYGATFKDSHKENLIYELTAVDSFNRNLVKGVTGHIMKFDTEKISIVRFVSSDDKTANFEFIDNSKKIKKFIVSKKESLGKIHPAMKDLKIENLKKNTAVLSNEVELKAGDKIDPYYYSETLQEIMIKKAIKHHFEEEKKYLTREVKIKPLTLFFIENIEEYRSEGGSIKRIVEESIIAEAKNLLKIEKDQFYLDYLQKTINDVSRTHGGYFAKDNAEKDEEIEREVNEILHDKQAILDLGNIRRFIFSKWTLREGWDNPNIFQICKLRSSGSEISRLQEVGRGLRLPVNQYGNRVKNEQFYLNYFVDFSEIDFIERLKNEINEESGAISEEDIPEKLTEKIIKLIFKEYKISEEDLLKKLDEDGVIKRNNDFTENGFDYIRKNYSLIFRGIGKDKIRDITESRKKLKIRVEKYSELKELWEKLNQKVVLEYKIENENRFKEIFMDFLTKEDFLRMEGIKEKIEKISIENNHAIVKEEGSVYGNETSSISTMSYASFLKQLSTKLFINLKTLHQCFSKKNINLDNYLNQTTIRIISKEFNGYLMEQAFKKFEIEYQKVTNSIHPTTITSPSGEIKNEIDASTIGRSFSDERVADNYFFDKLFYDSDLERKNIMLKIDGVVVFTKIPKGSIKIPISGGKSYSPDFAYVINFENGKRKLYFVVETKDAENEKDLRPEENEKIKHAKRFFEGAIEIQFRAQFKEKEISTLIQEIYNTEIVQN